MLAQETKHLILLLVLLSPLPLLMDVSPVRAEDLMDRKVSVNIVVGSSREYALVEWRGQSGVGVMMNAAAVQGKLTRGVTEKLTAKEKLTIVLDGPVESYTQQDNRIRSVISGPLVRTLMTDTGDGPGELTATNHPPTAPQASSASGNMNSSSPESSQEQRLDEVLVTAQKREERLQDVPMSISVLGGNALDTATSQGVLDELKRVPGVVIPPPSGLGVTQISIRGVGASGVQWDGASPVAYYLDSVPFGFVRSAYIPESGAFDLSRVEVLRGPQGTLYGANAEDGVVRVLPNEADPNGFDIKGRVFGSYTEYAGANRGGDVAINLPVIDGRLAVRAVADYQDLSGWINTGFAKDANDAQLRDYRVKLLYLPNDDLSIGLSEWSSRNRYGALPNSLPDRTESSVTSAEPINNDFDAYSAKVIYTMSELCITSMTSYLVYHDYNEFDVSPLGGFFIGLNLHSLGDSRVFSEELLLNSTDSRPWTWTAGAFYRDDRDIYTQEAFMGTVAVVDFNDKSRSDAVFGQVGRRFLGEQLEWTVGLRQFHDNVSTVSTDPTAPGAPVTDTYNATTPRAVLSWYPDANTTGYVSFSEGFRSGAPQYYQITQLASNIQSAKPDKLYNYEIGLKSNLFENRLVIDTSVYYVKWKDVQQPILVPYQGGLIQAVINGNSASGPGVDLSITTHPTDRLKMGGTFSWNGLRMDGPVISSGEVIFNAGDRLNNSSEYTGSVFSDYTVPLGGKASGEFSISGYYTSRQAVHGLSGQSLPYSNYGNNLLFLQAALTLNFTNSWSAKLYGDNLTNEYGSVFGPPVGFASTEDQGVPRPRPRTIGLEVDYRYK